MYSTTRIPAGESTSNGTTHTTNGTISKTMSYTVTGLKRWSSINTELPGVDQIRAIHVYDFDNTLFASPLPNKQIWQGSTIGFLQSQDQFVNGGWWHDASILACTGEGVEKEEPRAWKGWWNEDIVSLVELTMQQKDALSVLLTGRSETGFTELIQRIVKSKNLDFHMICLKPIATPTNQAITSTMQFKTAFFADLMNTYREAEEIRVYEDRVGHVNSFREYFTKYNTRLISKPSSLLNQRKPITAEVIHVSENATSLDPVTEIAEIQRMINAHNLAVRAGPVTPQRPPWRIKRTIFYTGYIISPETSEKLLTLVNIPPSTPNNEIRLFANNILITPRPAPRSILDKVGGIGNKVTWRVTGTALFENKLWAAKVQPYPKEQKVYSENPTPTVVLALRRNARPIDAARIQNWQPVSEEKAFVFETVVGEKVSLRIDEEKWGEDEYQSYFPHAALKRPHRSEEEMVIEDEEFPPLGAAPPSDRRAQQSSHPRPQERSNAWKTGNKFEVLGGYKGGSQGRGRGGQRYAPSGGRGGRGAYRGRGRGRGAGGESRAPDYGRQGRQYRDPDVNRRDQGGGGGGGGVALRNREGAGGDVYDAY